MGESLQARKRGVFALEPCLMFLRLGPNCTCTVFERPRRKVDVVFRVHKFKRPAIPSPRVYSITLCDWPATLFSINMSVAREQVQKEQVQEHSTICNWRAARQDLYAQVRPRRIIVAIAVLALANMRKLVI